MVTVPFTCWVGGWVGLRAGFRGEEHFLHIPTVEPRFLIEVLSLVSKSTKLHWLQIWFGDESVPHEEFHLGRADFEKEIGNCSGG